MLSDCDMGLDKEKILKDTISTLETGKLVVFWVNTEKSVFKTVEM